MKTFFIAITLFSSIQFKAYSQASVPFSPCPGSNVLVYKDGTSCTESPYNFYNLDLAGNISPFGSPTAAGIEINAIGINPVDNYLYGLQYVRTGISSPCTFANTHLIRMDAAGTIDDLGTLTPPPGGTISNAYGAISSDGNFIFYATISGNISIGSIPFSQLLSTGGTINPNYISVTNNCPGKSIADWAINPLDGNIYSYATFSETIGPTTYMRGVVMKIDLTTNTITCVGAVNTTELSDPLRDNFGGVMFGSDTYMYAVNVNTRKFYKIDVTNGNLTLVNTFAGSGNMRADLGSCTSAPIILPVILSDFTATSANCSAVLSWKLHDAADVVSQTVMYSADGKKFTEIFTSNDRLLNHWSDTENKTLNGYYRLMLKEQSGSVYFSPVKFVKSKCAAQKKLIVLQNPVGDMLHASYQSNSNSKGTFSVIDMLGSKIKQTPCLLNASLNTIHIPVVELSSGMYILQISLEDGTSTSTKFYKR